MDWLEEINLQNQKDLLSLNALNKLNLKSLNIVGTSSILIEQLKDIPSLEEIHVEISAQTPKPMDDLSQVSGLKKLNLVLSGLTPNDSYDLAPLAALKNLESLTVTTTQGSSYSGLEKLTQLTELDISIGTLDIKSIKALPLKKLVIRDETHSRIFINRIHAKLTSLALIGEMKDLEALSLESLDIHDISFLQGLTNLKDLDLSRNNIVSIEVLENLKNLESLNLFFNSIENPRFVTYKTGIKNLNLRGNRIPRIDITFMEELESLDVSANRNNFNSLAARGINPQLKELKLQQNGLRASAFSEVSAEAFPALETLDLSDNKLSHFGVIANFTSLKTLNVTDNKLTDLSELRAMNNLEYFFASLNLLTAEKLICPGQSETRCEFTNQEILPL